MHIEEIKADYQIQINGYLNEVRLERASWTAECRKLFEQWLDNIKFDCVMTTPIKLPFHPQDFKVDSPDPTLTTEARKRQNENYLAAESSLASF